MSLPELIKLLSERQSAEYLGVVPKTMQAWRVRGGGPTYLKIGRLVKYTQHDLDKWLEGRRRESTSDKGRASK